MGEGRSRLRRTISRWADSSDQHARELQKTVEGSGCCSIAAAPDREHIKLQGALRTVTLRPRGGVPALEAELFDGTDVYALSDQKTPERFAGQRVTVTGTLDVKTKTIRVESISAAK